MRNHARMAHEATLARCPRLDGWSPDFTSRRSYPDLFNDPLGSAAWFWTFSEGNCARAPTRMRWMPQCSATPRLP